MFSAEFTAGFLAILALAELVGLRPPGLLSVPPLNLFARGAATSFIGELIAYTLAYAAYQVAALATLRAIEGIGDLRGDMLRRALAEGRDSAGLRPVLWLALLSAPALVILAAAAHQVVDPARLAFVSALLSLTAAQALRQFEWADVWANARVIDSWFRATARPPMPAPAAVSRTEERHGRAVEPDRPPSDAGSDWLEGR